MPDLLKIVTRKEADVIGTFSANKKLTGAIETRSNVHAVHFYFKTAAGAACTRAEIIADIDDIVLKINGQVICEASATQLLDLFKYHADSKSVLTTAGCVSRYFTRHDLALAGLNRGFALGMLGPDGLGHNTLTYEINTQSSVTTVNSCEVYFDHDTLAPEPLGNHVRLLRYNETFTTTGLQEVTDLPKDKQGVGLLAYHVHTATGVMDKLSLKFNGTDRYENVNVNVMKLQQYKAGRTPQSNYYHIPLDLANDITAVQPLGPNNVTSLRFIPNWTTAPNGYEILAEEIHNGV